MTGSIPVIAPDMSISSGHHVYILPQSRTFMAESSCHGLPSLLRINGAGGIASTLFKSVDGFKNLGFNNIPSYTLSGLTYNKTKNTYEQKFPRPIINNVSAELASGDLGFTNHIPQDQMIPYIDNGTFGDNFLYDYPSPKLFDGNSDVDLTPIEPYSD
jgi:hypothetical protein